MSGIKIHHFIEILTGNPLDTNGLFHTYCIRMYEKIHKNEKGLIFRFFISRT